MQSKSKDFFFIEIVQSNSNEWNVIWSYWSI